MAITNDTHGHNPFENVLKEIHRLLQCEKCNSAKWQCCNFSKVVSTCTSYCTLTTYYSQVEK